MSKIKRFGWKPDLPDQRDFVYKLSRKAVKITSVDLREKNLMPNIFDQGDLGSCTGNSISFMLTFDALNKHTQNKTLCSLPFSRLFIYYNERSMEGTIQEDSGAQIRDGLKAVANLGTCSEKTWKYDIKKFAKKPTPTAFKSALKYKALNYKRLQNTDKEVLVTCLMNGYPFVFGFTVYDSFESKKVSTTGIVPMPLKSESVLGGHAVCCVGYDLPSDRFIVANSWGEIWGDKGYFTIPASYLTNENLASDFWVVETIL